MRWFLIQGVQRALLLSVTLVAGLLVLGLQPTLALFGQTHPGIS